MDHKKLEDALKDKDFIETIVKLQTPKKIEAAFKEKGIEISHKDMPFLSSAIKKMIKIQSANLSESDLEKISGGGPKRSAIKDFGYDMLFEGEVLAGLILLDFIYHSVPVGYKKIKDSLENTIQKRKLRKDQ